MLCCNYRTLSESHVIGLYYIRHIGGTQGKSIWTVAPHLFQ